MLLDKFVNRLACAVTNAPGLAGAAVLGAARPGMRRLDAGQDGQRFAVVFSDGLAWEIASGCVYTHSTGVLTRGTLVDSSSGARVDLSAATVVIGASHAAWADAVVSGLEAKAQNILTGIDTATKGSVVATDSVLQAIGKLAANQPALAFEFTQSSEASVWTINHPLQKRPVAVVLNGAGVEMLGVPSYPTQSQMTITFSSPVSGSAFLT